MFKIQPIQSSTEQHEVAIRCESCFREGYFAYAMRDCETGELMGFSQFEITQNYAYISDIRSVPDLNDYEAMFILGKTTMSFIEGCGIKVAKASSATADSAFLLALGFKNDEEDLFVADLSHMFNGHCHDNN